MYVAFDFRAAILPLNPPPMAGETRVRQLKLLFHTLIIFR